MSGNGRRWFAAAVLVGAILGCMPYGFAGGGLPQHVRSVAVLPFDNETAAPELPGEIHDSLRLALDRRLGLRDAPETRASALVRGTVRRFDVDIPIAYTAAPNQATTARRRLQITVDVEIVDQTNGRILWQRKGLVAEGEYNERQEAQGRRLAVQKLVHAVIEGAQSQW
ncbi:MAG: hypothetical protein NVS1B4_23310 [Gemmatimonadaceae bacterium]